MGTAITKAAVAQGSGRLPTLTYPSGHQVAYAYTARGELASVTDWGTPGTTTYTYDALDRLVGVAGRRSPATTYTANGDGLRVAATPVARPQDVRRTAWALLFGLAQPIVDTGQELVWGAGEFLRVPAAQQGHTDVRGSVRLVTDAAGQVAGSTEYDAWGTVSSQSGAGAAVGYTGALGEAGLVYLRARYYDPATGRFLSRDPLRGRRAEPRSKHG